MKYLLLPIVFVLVITACDPPRADFKSGLGKERKWSGYHSRYLSGFPADTSNFSKTITDTIFAVKDLGNNMVSIPFTSIPLHYNGKNDVKNAMKYDSITMYAQKDSLMYYHSADSVVFYYFALYPSPKYGMHSPYMEYIFLYSHK